MGFVFVVLVALAVGFYILAEKVPVLASMFITLSAIAGLLAAVCLLGFGDST